jgi:predicted Fe-S protein YdhL (DUF1289 family)
VKNKVVRKLKSDETIKSPCIGVCSTGIGDLVCRGCKRFTHEVIQWNSYSNDEKLTIQNRLDYLLRQVISARIAIVDELRLKTEMDRLHIRYSAAASPYTWLFDVLKAGASQIESLETFGCESVASKSAKKVTANKRLDFIALRDEIDADFFILSSVHYQRYFQ